MCISHHKPPSGLMAHHLTFVVSIFVSGTFKLTVEFTEEYPNKPPTVRFVSKMFHPNGRCTVTQHIMLLMCYLLSV